MTEQRSFLETLALSPWVFGLGVTLVALGILLFLFRDAVRETVRECLKGFGAQS